MDVQFISLFPHCAFLPYVIFNNFSHFIIFHLMGSIKKYHEVVSLVGQTSREMH